MNTSVIDSDLMFLTFPAISVVKNEQNNEITVDRFNLSVIAAYITAVNEVPEQQVQAPDATAVVHFDPSCGLRPVLTSAPAQQLAALVTHGDSNDGVFMAIEAVAPTQSGQEVVTYAVNVDIDMIVAVNSLDGTSKQIDDTVNTIIYFKPSSGMQPILVKENAADVRQFILDNVW